MLQLPIAIICAISYLLHRLYYILKTIQAHGRFALAIAWAAVHKVWVNSSLLFNQIRNVTSPCKCILVSCLVHAHILKARRVYDITSKPGVSVIADICLESRKFI